MPQFVLLYHECPSAMPRNSHWDLMLEHGGVLRTWVFRDLPALLAGQHLLVEEIQPHRVDYLDLEGPLSDGRGSVARVDRGAMKPNAISDQRMNVELSGQVIHGTLELTRFSPDTPWWRVILMSGEDGAG